MRGGPRALQNSRLRPPAKYGQTWVFGALHGAPCWRSPHKISTVPSGLDSERIGDPHVKIWSKFEALGPRNGRGATWQNASLVKVVFLGFGAVKSGKRGLLHTNFSSFDYD